MSQLLCFAPLSSLVIPRTTHSSKISKHIFVSDSDSVSWEPKAKAMCDPFPTMTAKGGALWWEAFGKVFLIFTKRTQDDLVSFASSELGCAWT